MAIMLNNHGLDQQPWIDAFNHLLPEIEIRCYPDVGNTEDIEYAVIWDHPHGDLHRYPNLKAILLLSAGVDFLQGDESIPDDIPIVRLIDDAVARDMAQHTLHWVMHFHRQYYQYAHNQQNRLWQLLDYPANSERRIGILGLGAMGSKVAEELLQAGFPVKAWVRSPREQKQIELFVGNRQQDDFFRQSDILINILPNTPNTRNLLNTRTFNLLPKGAFLINIGRGATVDEEALKEALDQGQIAAAALDVFCQEPLPVDHWMWQHPAIFITPHASGNTYARSGAINVAANIRRIQQGKSAFPLYDPGRGY